MSVTVGQLLCGALLGSALLQASKVTAQQRTDTVVTRAASQDMQTAVPPCSGGGGGASGLVPRLPLYCIDLIPTPDLRGARGRVDLLHVASPFDVAVDVDGQFLYDLAATTAGLPDPRTLGPYTTYVAWATTFTLDPMIRLGALSEGTTRLGQTNLAQLLILVTAEADANVTERRGKLVLRGMSAQGRMRPLELTMAATSSAGAHTAHGGETRTTANDGVRWVMPPMDSTLPAMPWLDDLLPEATPFLPATGPSARDVRPRHDVMLRSGDTIRLSAELVRRTVRGHTYTGYGYDGLAVGPLFSVEEGSSVVVEFRNNIDLPSSIHWHGLRLENNADGAVGVTQQAVEPGGGFRYRLTFPDPGVFWYHPHQRADIQQDLGLVGNIVVRSRRADYFAPANRTEILILDDLLLGAQGLVPFGKEVASHALMGRFGNVFLVNGQPDYALSVPRGAVVRFMLTNASNVRTFNLSFSGARMKLVGADIGTFEREEWVTSVMIAPAQRYIVDVRFEQPGKHVLTNRVQSISQVFGYAFPQVDTLGAVLVSDAVASPDHALPFSQLRANAHMSGEVDAVLARVPAAHSRELTLALRVRDLPFGLTVSMDSSYFPPVEWTDAMPMMNWLVTSKQAEWILREPASGKENMQIDWSFRTGDLLRLRISNDVRSFHPMFHPIHIHGQRFLVLAHNDTPATNQAWKDTVIVPVGGSVDLLVEMSNPGQWMLHCHISEHLESGMHTVFTVTPKD